MTLRYLLDTDTLSELVLRPRGAVASEIGRRGERAICTSVLVAAELRFGASKRGSPALTQNVEAVIAALKVLPFEEPADRRYAEIRVHLERRGTPIGPNDMLIAAQALSLGLTVVTGNVAEYTRVPGLDVDNWIR